MGVFPFYCRPFLEMPNRPKYIVNLQKIKYIDSFMYALDDDVNLLRNAIEENDIVLLHNVLNCIKNRCTDLLDKKVKPMLEEEIKKAKESNQKI